MDRPWTAERDVSAEEARALIEEQFPELRPARIELLGVGWDNTAYRVDGTLVFRFPRREIAVEPIRTESRVLRVIAELLPLPIPVPEFLGEPSEDYPWPFAGYRWIAGETACRARPDGAQRAHAARPLAEFLRALHAVPLDTAARAGAGADTLGRLELAKRCGQIEERLGEAVRLGLIARPRRWRRVLEDLPTGWSARACALVHGDLYARHVLVDAERRPCGVIDWGDVHLGDPAVDLSIAHGFLPPPARAAFRDAYGPIDPDGWRVARMKALHAALTVLVYAHDARDRALADEAARALEHLATD